MYAAGKIPGSFFKREGRAGEKGTLTARMIDRPIRPLFPKGWHFETQLVALTLSVDHVHPYDILAMNGASAALMISEVPLPTPGRRGAHRQGRRQLRHQPARGVADRQHRPRPHRRRHRGRDPHGRGRGERDPRGRDPRRARHRPRADQEALRRCSGSCAEKAGKEKLEVVAPQVDEGLLEEIRASHGAAARRGHAGRTTSSSARRPRRRSRRRSWSSTPARPTPTTYDEYRQRAQLAFDRLEKQVIRERIAREKKRPDGRGEKEIRPITIEVGVTPRDPRLGALHARPDAGPLRGRAGHAEGGDAARHPRAADPEVLLAPLQLPAVLGGRGRLHARPQAPRHRPRGARRAGAGAGRPEHGGLPVHDPRRVGHPGVQRLVLDGLGVRLARWP